MFPASRELIAQLLDRREGFGARRIEIGKLDSLVVLVKVVAVADVEEKAGHGALGLASSGSVSNRLEA